MIFEHSLKNKNVLLITSIIILLLGVFILFYFPAIFQEGNPWPQIKGIAQLNFGNKDIVKLDIGENKYITKSDKLEIIKSFMKEKGYDFTEQIGSGYFFKSDDKTSAVAVHRYYSRYYSLWSIAENLVTKDTTLTDKLKECLPKSDMVSHERCNELLATIRNFDDCVTAGFSIMKSNPSQCATPDGRNFTDEANSNWNIVLTAINNCEVESVFQTHSKLVTLKLKNGDKITAYEPQIDDVMKVVESLNGQCGHIRLATE
ncbi:MAG: hypothetical protein WC933_01085 [Candidatus Paceibacterota bacterium]|jgi:hypothetical protein